MHRVIVEVEEEKYECIKTLRNEILYELQLVGK